MEDSKTKKEREELANCTFQPQFLTKTNKSFEKSITIEKPRGFDQAVERMRNGILENWKKKYLIEKY